MSKNKRSSYISFGLIIGSMIGLFLDMYKIDLYGAVGLGIVYTPVIGLCLGIIIDSILTKKPSVD
jgi:hypothetical protein